MSVVLLVVLFGLYERGESKMCTRPQLLANVVHGKMLPGFQMLNRSSAGIMECSRFCQVRKRCKSFNFDTEIGECQLNTDSPTDETYFRADSKFIFSDISTWPSRLAEACAEHICPLNTFCDPVDKVLYNCVAEYCFGGPVIENGFLKSPQELLVNPLGTKLDIICNQGYLLEKEVVCHNNGTWSHGVCVALTSCSMVKQMQSNSEDGEYWLFVTSNMHLSRIYCHNMASEDPEEFLSLRNLNYGIYPNITTHNCIDEKALSWSCTGKEAEIWFIKIKVNIQMSTSLGVFTKDITFANFTKLQDWFEYGHALDCYADHINGSLSCGVKGWFTIDLQGTGWRISEDQIWDTVGWQPFMHPPLRTLNGTVIKLNCGGFVGGCKPAGGLFLTPYPEGLTFDEE